MSIDHSIVIKLHKSGESNSEIAKRLKMNCTTVRKIIKKFQEIGTTLDREGRGQKRTVHTSQLIKNTKEKLRCNSCRSCRNWAAAPGVGKSTMHQLLREDLGVKPFKINRHVVMRAKKCRKLLQDIVEGTLPNLVFTDKKKFHIQKAVNQKNDRVWVSSSTTEGRIVTRCQNLQYVMVWAAVTATRRSPLLFVPTGVKLNSEQYI